MQVIQPWTTDPCLNLAFEEVLLKHTSGNFCLVWQNSPTVVIGRHQDAADEVNLPLADSLDIPVIRRISGGGAVYHDNGTINLSFITEHSYSTDKLLQKMLHIFPNNITSTKRNDVLINGKKVMGTAQYQIGLRQLFHASILFNTDLELLDQILTPSSEKMHRHGISSVIQRVTNLSEFISPAQPIERFAADLISVLCPVSKPLYLSPENELILRTHHLADQKYRSNEWNRIRKSSNDT